jgi:PAS domain S-box-containing protein
MKILLFGDVGSPTKGDDPEMVATSSAQPKRTGSGTSAESLLRAVIAVSDDAIFTLDSTGSVASWSRTSERIFGFHAEDVLEGPLERLFAEHLHSDVRSVVSRALAGEPIRHHETEVVRPDGMPMPVWMSLSPIAGEDGLPKAAVVVVRDVTEQRLAQASLGEVEARLEEGENLAHVGSWLWDVRTGTAQWSSEFHRIHGLDPLEFDGTFESQLSLIHLADRDRIRRTMEVSVVSGMPFESEYRVVRPDGGVRVLHVRAHPIIGSAGTAVGLRGIGQDVTERAG